ncbi:MAG: hypothetical protein IJ862_07405 [Selenomonadaceae bacterium]|nr:hypothetical protein [Selenomonadaceae bacterium]
MKLVRKILILYIISFSFLNLPNVVFAEPHSIHAEGEYRLGDRDTREKAKKAALEDAKRKLTEQVDFYIESYTVVHNFKVTKDQIKSFARAKLKIKSERVEFFENGTICKAFVTAVIDVSRINEPEPDDGKGKNKKSNSKSEYVDFANLEASRTSIIKDLSKATSFTAASEYKLQEVTGITDIGHYDEKGSIANSLQDKPEMNKNYRFAELDSFIDEAGAENIMDILNQKNDKNAKERMTWAKHDRLRANKYKDLVIKAASALSKKISKFLSKANDMDRERLQALKIEVDDAIKLVKALDIKNKAIDKVVQKYEKLNKIVVKSK